MFTKKITLIFVSCLLLTTLPTAVALSVDNVVTISNIKGLVQVKKIDGDWKIVWDAPVSEIPLPISDVSSNVDE